ncbi:MAG: PHP domain-containing protein, partial [Actinobacteria bacterium]|nr:PHP domain-containing protein [Actinomycetota bacterium]
MILLQNRKKQILFVSIFIVLILVLSFFFHYSIHIENALTSQPTEGFSVKVHTLRIVFEPVLGPLLFYLRADQPLVEMLVLMLWVILAFFVVSFWKAFRNPRGRFLHTFWVGLKNWLVRLPIIIITFVALILVIIFLPLPSNTIVNHQNDTILLNTHSHTYYSHDGLISQKNLMRWHRRNGFDAFFITDHNNHLKTLEFVRAQKAGKIPASPLVFCGEEYSGSNHITLLGLQRDFKTKDMADSTAIDSAHANGGVGIIAHWFADEHRTIQYYISCGADGFEIANQAEGLSYSRCIFRAIVEKCRENGLLMVGACDYHGYGSAAFTWNALQIPGWQNLTEEQKRSSVMNILRQHQESKIKVLVYRDRYVFP